jgi:hypothetical protein
MQKGCWECSVHWQQKFQRKYNSQGLIWLYSGGTLTRFVAGHRRRGEGLTGPKLEESGVSRRGVRAECFRDSEAMVL